MSTTEPADRPANEDLTARARIRDAALQHFAEDGYARATIRAIARTAGVSPGLVRHHFGSKEGLRDACDEHVASAVRRINDELLAEGGNRDPGFGAARFTGQPFSGYIGRALVDQSPFAARLFDEMTGASELWLLRADQDRPDPPTVDLRSRAALITAMALGVPMLREHVSRALGADIFSPEGDRLMALALIDIYSHRLLDPELAHLARHALEEKTT